MAPMALTIRRRKTTINVVPPAVWGCSQATAAIDKTIPIADKNVCFCKTLIMLTPAVRSRPVVMRIQ
jgi:hypothetical protein